MNSELTLPLDKAEALLTPLATFHTPEGSVVKAVVDQWLHALATDSQFFCLRSVDSPEKLKKEALKLLKKEGLYTSRKQFYDTVFGELALKPTYQSKFRFIDLFAGIGGMRLGFQNVGGACVFSPEFDKKAQETYELNHGEFPFGDITNISPNADTLQ